MIYWGIKFCGPFCGALVGPEDSSVAHASTATMYIQHNSRATAPHKTLFLTCEIVCTPRYIIYFWFCCVRCERVSRRWLRENRCFNLLRGIFLTWDIYDRKLGPPRINIPHNRNFGNSPAARCGTISHVLYIIRLVQSASLYSFSRGFTAAYSQCDGICKPHHQCIQSYWIRIFTLYFIYF